MIFNLAWILTIQEDIIKAAKRKAKRKGMSVSKMFEEVIEKGEKNEIETESQRAAKRLLQKLKKEEGIETKMVPITLSPEISLIINKHLSAFLF